MARRSREEWNGQGRVDVPLVMRRAVRHGHADKGPQRAPGCPFSSAALVVLERADGLPGPGRCLVFPGIQGKLVAAIFGRLLKDLGSVSAHTGSHHQVTVRQPAPCTHTGDRK